MANTAGDKSKQPKECNVNGAPPSCPNLTQTYQGYDKETYHCAVCGEHYNLYYEDMQ